MTHEPDPEAAMATTLTYTQVLQRVETKLDAILAALGAGPTPPVPPIPPPPAPPVPAPTPAPPAGIQAVYWINRSGDDLSMADAQAIVAALNIQAAHVVDTWPGLAPITHVLSAGNPTTLPETVWPMYWLPDADTAGALGYHDVDPHGRPYGRVFTRYKGKAWPALKPTGDRISISNISSHEAVEIQVDPPCTLTDTAPNGDVWAREVGDPVESFSYTITTPTGEAVSVSDFATAAFFGHGSGPADYMSQTHPFTIAPGGYAVINDRQVFADEPSLRFLSQQGSPAGRTARRLQVSRARDT